MSRVLALLGAVGALLLPAGALAAALCSTVGGGATSSITVGGRVKIVSAICLCNAAFDCDPTATAAATFDYDLTAMGGAGSSLRTQPDIVIFERNLTTACTADLTASFLTGPDADTLHTLGSTSAINAATTRLVVDLQRAPLDRFLNVALTNTTDCTDSEIIMLYGEVER